MADTLVLDGPPPTAEVPAAAPAPPAPAPTLAERRRHLHLHGLRTVWLVALGVGALQAAGLIAFSALQYSRFDLGLDFATANQATWLIAHGHLYPWASTHSQWFAQDHAAFVAWPLALLSLVSPSPFTLLVVQDLVLVATGLVGVRWVAEMAEDRLAHAPGALTRRSATLLVAGALAVTVVDPWVVQAAAFDFHFEPFCALFLVLCARDCWARRPGRALVWGAAVLLCGDLGGWYLLGLGLGVALACRGIRRFGGVLAAMGLAWILVVHALGLGTGDSLAGYAYLAGGPPSAVTAGAVARSAVTHPGRWASAVWDKRGPLYENLIPTGFLGLANPLTFGVTAVVFLSATLIGPSIFLESGFQGFPAYTIGLCGTALVLVALLGGATTRRSARWRRVAAGVLALAIVAQCAGLAVAMGPRTKTMWIRVSAPAAATLDAMAARIPPDAEVVASWGVMGRFSSRPWIYGVHYADETYPVHARTVDFLLSFGPGIENLTPPQSFAEALHVVHVLHARVLVSGHDLLLAEWHPPAGTTGVRLS